MRLGSTYGSVSVRVIKYPPHAVRFIFSLQTEPIRTVNAPSLKKQDDFDSCFLTVLGMEMEYPFGPPRKTPSLF